MKTSFLISDLKGDNVPKTCKALFPRSNVFLTETINGFSVGNGGTVVVVVVEGVCVLGASVVGGLVLEASVDGVSELSSGCGVLDGDVHDSALFK